MTLVVQIGFTIQQLTLKTRSPPVWSRSCFFTRCLHLVHHLPLPPLGLGIHLPFSTHKVFIKGHSEPDSRKEFAMDWKSMRRTLLMIWMPLGSEGQEMEEKNRFLESLNISMIGNVCISYCPTKKYDVFRKLHLISFETFVCDWKSSGEIFFIESRKGFIRCVFSGLAWSNIFYLFPVARDVLWVGAKAGRKLS